MRLLSKDEEGNFGALGARVVNSDINGDFLVFLGGIEVDKLSESLRWRGRCGVDGQRQNAVKMFGGIVFFAFLLFLGLLLGPSRCFLRLFLFFSSLFQSILTGCFGSASSFDREGRLGSFCEAMVTTFGCGAAVGYVECRKPADD